jgi:hypothetical protein
MKETRGRYQKKENDLDIARAVLTKKKKKPKKFYQQKKENCSMARARLLTPNVVICSADERIRLVRLLRYSNKQTRDK